MRCVEPVVQRDDLPQRARLELRRNIHAMRAPVHGGMFAELGIG